jgi:hypothetical protein
MVNKTISIFLLIISISFIMNACSTPIPPNDITSSDKQFQLDLVFDKMEPWQVEYVKEHQLDKNTNISSYLEQEGMLESYGYKRKEKPEETMLLDKYHQVYGWWYLMRENMTVLHTEEHSGRQYSLILTLGSEGCNGIHLVSYEISNDTVEILEYIDGELPISSGFYPNTGVLHNENIFFGITKKTRLDTETDKKVPSDFHTLEIFHSEGKESKDHIKDEDVILYFFPAETKLTSCQLLNKKGEIVEKYDLTEESQIN